MKIMYIVAFIIIVKSIFVILDVSFVEFSDFLFGFIQKERKMTLYEKKLKLTKNKKQKKIISLLKETQMILKTTNKGNKFSTVCLSSLIAIITGIIFAISIENWFLVPVFALGFGMIPFWYVLLISNKWRKKISNDLETTLSVVTNSYIRNNNIITAIEENVEYMNPEIAKVFQSFLVETKLISSNKKMALEKLKEKIDNPVFKEWTEQVIQCQDDRNLKSGLFPIVHKLSSAKLINAELANLLYEPIKEIFMVSLIIILNLPLLYLVNKDWFEIMIHHPLGKIVTSITYLIMFIAIGAAIKITKPLDADATK